MKTRRKLWFRARRFGWGWYPAAWQGWAVTVAYLIAYVASGMAYGALAPAAIASGGSVAAGTTLLLSWYALLTASLLAICYRHGEKPSWRWQWRRKRSSSPE